MTIQEFDDLENEDRRRDRMTILENLGRTIQELVVHEIDIITDTEWFADLVMAKVDQVLQDQKDGEVKHG
jgi:hypothetical protein